MPEIQPKSVTELLRNIDASWNTFCAFIDSLSEARLTQPTDAAGWTAKDHLAHLATWEDTLNSLLERRPQWESMGIDKALWDSHDIDRINAIVQKRRRDMPLSEIRDKHRDIHRRLLTNIASLSDEDLQRPVHEYQPGSDDSRPILRNLMSDTYEAYEEHTPWIAAIAAKV